MKSSRKFKREAKQTKRLNDKSEDTDTSDTYDNVESKPLKKKFGNLSKGFKISGYVIKLLTIALILAFAALFVYSFANFVWAAILGASIKSKPAILRDVVIFRVPMVTMGINMIEMVVFLFSFFTFIKLSQLRKKSIGKSKRFYKYILISRWLIISLLLALIMLWLVNIFEKEVINNRIQNNIIEAIKVYSDDLAVKKELNSIQLNYQCCGGKDYKDWAYQSWYDKKDIPPVYANQMIQKDVPFSCCMKNILHYCVYYDIDKNVIKYQNQAPDVISINQDGCAQALAKEIKLFTAFRDSIILYLIIVLVILRLIETNYYTSRILKVQPVSYLFRYKRD